MSLSNCDNDEAKGSMRPILLLEHADNVDGSSESQEIATRMKTRWRRFLGQISVQAPLMQTLQRLVSLLKRAVDRLTHIQDLHMSKTTFPFLKLPAEIRVMIYGIVLKPSKLRVYIDDFEALYNDVMELAADRVYLPIIRGQRTARNLLTTNRQTRIEMAARLFQLTCLDLTTGTVCLQTTLRVLHVIGRFGRDNIRTISLRWIDSSWANTSWTNTRRYNVDTAKEVACLLKNCPKLKTLKTKMPASHWGELEISAKPFGMHHALDALHSIDHVPEAHLLGGCSRLVIGEHEAVGKEWLGGKLRLQFESAASDDRGSIAKVRL
ncbi:uncharacterized protein BDZ99DRAFT_482700 [Mytilinidion resinicola]|uniref:Uncharacterized protein n=1 Tax=Mytilinidion resinicola TaxID=574789 RepID=A0A6A6Y1B2_9PEZI|nr:uncharacterized protein BDZ99DRAFT_482700 [Mytilinidion resinicola]KAF2802562.1 hypothetical protein BDZ99DRAFT_482700 [Mytilinidion resinicola]